MSGRLITALLLGLVVACATQGTPTPTVLDSGIRGTVTLAPTCAAEDSDETPCTTPYAAQLVITDPAGDVAARVSSGQDGRFEVVLPPGEYTIVPVNGDPFPTALARDVTVAPGQFAELEINYDSGIR